MRIFDANDFGNHSYDCHAHASFFFNDIKEKSEDCKPTHTVQLFSAHIKM